MLRTDRPGPSSTNSDAVATAGIDPPSGSDPLGPSPFAPGRLELGSSLRALRFAVWGAAVLLGALDAWFWQFSMNPDGVSYIDIGAAYARGDWGHALNAYWSPLYSWILALALRLLRPSAAAEFPVAHLVNLIIFVAALGCFEYFWRAWMQDHQARTAASRRAGWISLPPWALLAIGYSLFTWASISWIGVQLVTPDLLLTALVYLAAGLTLRLRRGEHRPRAAALLGAVLGFGFLAKAVMLPLALVFLLVAFLPARNPRRAVLSLLSAGIAFLIVTAPFIYGLSCKQGHLTLGDTGRLNYAWFVNGTPMLNWQGEIPGHGKPKHPTRLIYPAPPVYEFAGPIRGTYPNWTDPSYWNEGVRVRFNWRQQARALLKNLKKYRQLLWADQSGLIAGVLMLLLTTARVGKRRLSSLVRGDLLLISVAPVIMYGLVVVEPRYLGAFIMLFWLALLPEIRLPANETSKAMVVSATFVILLTPALGLARTSTRDILQRSMGRSAWETATGLRAIGIHAGDRVGCIGRLAFDIGWPRLARVSVVAAIPSGREAEYWGAGPTVRAAVLRAFAKAGARAVLTASPPAACVASGWHRLGATVWYVRLLDPPTQSSFARASTRLLSSPPTRQSELAIRDASAPNGLSTGK
jgi:hypothetical protein